VRPRPGGLHRAGAPLGGFFAYEPGFLGGVTVSAVGREARPVATFRSLARP
jgi:hypothetical protein